MPRSASFQSRLAKRAEIFFLKRADCYFCPHSYEKHKYENPTPETSPDYATTTVRKILVDGFRIISSQNVQFDAMRTPNNCSS
jgi:hypothetical protein